MCRGWRCPHAWWWGARTARGWRRHGRSCWTWGRAGSCTCAGSPPTYALLTQAKNIRLWRPILFVCCTYSLWRKFNCVKKPQSEANKIRESLGNLRAKGGVVPPSVFIQLLTCADQIHFILHDFAAYFYSWQDYYLLERTPHNNGKGRRVHISRKTRKKQCRGSGSVLFWSAGSGSGHRRAQMTHKNRKN